MTAKVTFFPVGNGDMTLIETESGEKILIDVNIRAAADDPDDDTPDVASMLRDRLERDSEGRLYVDTFLLSHPDQDHCAGLRKHFHLGPPEDWSSEQDKIFIREFWSSPTVFRRASRQHTLCDDAKAFNTEARRRVKQFRENSGSVPKGSRILILGEDEDGKTDDLTSILIRVDEEFSRINGSNVDSMKARLLAPLPKDTDESEEQLAKNHSSTILRFTITGEGDPEGCLFLTGGDAEVAVWEQIWERNQSRTSWLQYDILQAPHHCSWRSLSYDSWSKKGEDAKVCPNARNALSQTRYGAVVVSSSKPIQDDDSDPPCIRAKREYEAIVVGKTNFKCTGDGDNPIEFEILKYGPRIMSARMTAPYIISGAIGSRPFEHG